MMATLYVGWLLMFGALAVALTPALDIVGNTSILGSTLAGFLLIFGSALDLYMFPQGWRHGLRHWDSD